MNIVELVEALLRSNPTCEIRVVDDSSPDGTAAAVAEAIAGRPGWGGRVHLAVRGKKDGRGGAVREGFAWGMARGGYDAFVEMDCDFSHDPAALPHGLSLLDQGYDVVVGARYPNGQILNVTLDRRVLSLLANALARTLIDRSIPDYTGGFRFYRPNAVEELLRHRQKHTGYIYLSEMMSHLLRAKFRVGAFPICFRNRERGTSNASFNEIRSSFTGIFQIALDHHLRRE